MNSSPMDRALALARRARGSTRPNPPVGAVLVKDGEIVGEGFTQPAGGPHAEIVALHDAGERAAGADLYVTLEPCSHWGRTPPCADALIAAHVGRVHVAQLDPNPLVNGTGVARLREHGIPVEVGERAEEAADLIEAHATLMRLHRPFITLAMGTPDSCLEEIGRDADVLLTDQHNPARWKRPIYCIDPGPPLEITRTRMGDRDARTWYAAVHVGSPTLSGLTRALGSEGFSSVLVAGSSRMGTAFLEDGLIDRIVAGPQTAVPAGFSARPSAHAPESCRVYYPERPH